MKHKALLFDLDGVLTDTAKYHFLAWSQLAKELGIPFTIKDNERLKGVSRTRSLEIILEIGGVEMDEEKMAACCEKKNNIYVGYISKMTPEETLPGAREFLEACKKEGYLIGLGSASKNTMTILGRLGLESSFDTIVDGTKVSKAKPDPEVFLRGALDLHVRPDDCIVFEDAAAGIEAAHRAGMMAVGVGSADALPMADLVISGFPGVQMSEIEEKLPLRKEED